MKKIITNTNGTMAMKLDVLAKQREGKVYNLAAGDIILEPNEDLQEGLIRARNSYCSSKGDLELRKFFNNNPNEVVISNGAKQLLYMSLMATCDVEDEVVIIGPCWSSYYEICKLWKLEYKVCLDENVEKYINKDTCAVLFNNPNNPTGKIYSKEFIEKLHKLCIENGCWLISDEIYDKIIYDNNEFYSLKNKENVIYINGLSKCCGLTGWRFGYCICEERLAEQISLIQSQISGPPNTVIQDTIKYIIKNKELPYLDINELEEKRDFICSCGKLFEENKPQAGFYFYIPVIDSEKVCEEYLEKYGIVMCPGDDYGIKDTIRISFSYISLEDLKEIKGALEELSRTQYKEIVKLHKLLEENKIEHIFEKTGSIYRICYPTNDDFYMLLDVMEKDGYLEMLLNHFSGSGTLISELSAEDCLRKIKTIGGKKDEI